MFTVVWDVLEVRYLCPVEGCPGGSTNSYNLRSHFCTCHQNDQVVVRGRNYPCCELCNMQLSNAYSLRHT